MQGTCHTVSPVLGSPAYRSRARYPARRLTICSFFSQWKNRICDRSTEKYMLYVHILKDEEGQPFITLSPPRYDVVQIIWELLRLFSNTLCGMCRHDVAHSIPFGLSWSNENWGVILYSFNYTPDPCPERFTRCGAQYGPVHYSLFPRKLVTVSPPKKTPPISCWTRLAYHSPVHIT